jgi:hypothetical protein
MVEEVTYILGAGRNLPQVPWLNLERVSVQKPDSLVAVGIGDLYLLHEEREDDLVRVIATDNRESMLV